MPRPSRILIVDDHPTNVSVLQKILGQDYRIASATSGDRALEAIARHHPDLVLLDIMLPGMDGYETCRRIRANPISRWTKVIMVSAKAMTSERLQGYESGADDYLVKPFDPDELLAKVRVHLQLRYAEEVMYLNSSFLQLLRSGTRNPLSAMIFPAQQLMQPGAMPENERHELAQAILHSATRLRRLFDKVQLLALLKARQMEFRLEPTDLGALIRECITAITPQATAKLVRVETRMHEPLAALLDRALMTSVIAPLLDNALRHSRSGSAIEVTASGGEAGLKLSIGNQGTPLPAAFLPHVFDEFAVRGDGDRAEGQGLSLAIARRIVRGHGGDLTVTSSAEGVTTFTLEIPAGAPVAAETQVVRAR